MSAVMQQPQQQLGIEGLAPAIQPELQVVIAGRLARPATLRIGTDGCPRVALEVRQAGDSLPFVATYRGERHDVAALEHQVQHELGRGAAVMIRGAGLELEPPDDDERTPGSGRLRLRTCSSVRALRFDDPAEAALV